MGSKINLSYLGNGVYSIISGLELPHSKSAFVFLSRFVKPKEERIMTEFKAFLADPEKHYHTLKDVPPQAYQFIFDEIKEMNFCDVLTKAAGENNSLLEDDLKLAVKYDPYVEEEGTNFLRFELALFPPVEISFQKPPSIRDLVDHFDHLDLTFSSDPDSEIKISEDELNDRSIGRQWLIDLVYQNGLIPRQELEVLLKYKHDGVACYFQWPGTFGDAHVDLSRMLDHFYPLLDYDALPDISMRVMYEEIMPEIINEWPHQILIDQLRAEEEEQKKVVKKKRKLVTTGKTQLRPSFLRLVPKS